MFSAEPWKKLSRIATSAAPSRRNSSALAEPDQAGAPDDQEAMAFDRQGLCGLGMKLRIGVELMAASSAGPREV